MAGLAEICEDIAQALRTIGAEVPGLQVYPFWNPNPTPPSIDMFPGTPFQTSSAFGTGETQLFWDIRARVSTADSEAGTRLLLRLLDPNDPASVETAVAGLVTVVDDGVSGFQEYQQDTETNGRLLGCEWRTTMYLNGG